MQPVILAGGRSARFGEEKALFKWRDTAFIDHIISVLGQVFDGDELWVSVDHIGNRAKLNDHLSTRDDIVYIEDGPSGIEGPLAGVAASLAYAERAGVPWCFLVACDMPAVRPGLILEFAALALSPECEGTSAIVPRSLVHGSPQVQPLHAFYRPAPCLEALHTYVASGQRSLQGFVEALPAARIVEPDELDGMDPLWRQAMTNVNRPDDVHALEADLQRG